MPPLINDRAYLAKSNIARITMAIVRLVFHADGSRVSVSQAELADKVYDLVYAFDEGRGQRIRQIRALLDMIKELSNAWEGEVK